jgi:hypothetical protein
VLTRVRCIPYNNFDNSDISCSLVPLSVRDTSLGIASLAEAGDIVARRAFHIYGTC